MANEFTTYDQIGMAEDVSSLISNIDPTDTPFQSQIGTEKCSARNPEWQEDDLASAVQASIDGKVEGFEYLAEERSATTMRSNYTEIRGTSFDVSETADAVRTYGRAKETAYQMMKVGKEQKIYWEQKLLAHDAATDDAVVGIDASLGDEEGDTAAARTAGNVWGQDVSSNNILVNRKADSVAGTGDGTLDFDEDAFLAGMQKTYDEGAPGKVLMVSPGVSLFIKDWATLPSGRFRDSEQDKKVTMVVDYLVTPFGEVKVVLNRWLGSDLDGSIHSDTNANAALLMDPSYWKILTLRPWKSGPLAKTSDSHKYYIRGEFSLKHRNYNEGYGWVNLSDPYP